MPTDVEWARHCKQLIWEERYQNLKKQNKTEQNKMKSKMHTFRRWMGSAISNKNSNLSYLIYLCESACGSPFMRVSLRIEMARNCGAVLALLYLPAFWDCTLLVFLVPGLRRWNGWAVVAVNCAKIAERFLKLLRWTEGTDHCDIFDSPRPMDRGKYSLAGVTTLNRRSCIENI